MAYPAIDAPYGLVPVGLVGGRPMTHGIRQFDIASGYVTSIFNGDAVTMVTDGTVERDAADAAMTPVGVFVGCAYTDPTYGLTFSNKWPGGTVAADAVAYVVDDPDTLFKVAVVSSGTTIGSLAKTDIGANVAMVDNAGVATNGRSRIAISDTTAVTATLPLRIVDLVDETRDSSGGYTEAIVKWNAGHSYNTALGI